jgi:hypothetical protein
MYSDSRAFGKNSKPKGYTAPPQRKVKSRSLIPKRFAYQYVKERSSYEFTIKLQF